MARLKHQPSSSQGGFRPIQLSRQAINRMQAESNRVVANMERNRQAEIQQRRETLQNMKEDAAYTDRQQQRNFEIQQQNLQVGLIQAQLDAKTQTSQAAIDAKQAEQIFGGLASLSKSAGDIAKTVEKNRLENEVNSKYISSSLGLQEDENSVYRRNAELALQERGEQYETYVQTQLAQGLDPNAGAKALVANPAVTHLSNRSSANYLLTNQFPLYLDGVLNDAESQFEFNGKIVTPADARNDPQLLQVIGQVAKVQFLKKKNLWGLDDKMLIDGLRSTDQYIKTLTNAASNRQTANAYDMRRDQLFGIGLNQPERFAENGVTIFRGLARDPRLGYAGAHEEFKKFATAEDQDGFLIPLEVIGSLDVTGNGKTYAEEFPGRFNDMKQARVDAELKRARREFAIDDVAYQTDVKRIITGLTEDPSQANADKAVEFFRDTYGKVPSEISKFQASYTIEAVDKIKRAKQLLSIPTGFVTLEAVEAAEALDADTGREMRTRLVEQEKRYNSGIFKETAEAFKSTANGITAYGTNKPNTPASVFLQTMMKSEFRKRVDQAVAGGADFNQAATTIGQQLDQEVKQGARNPESIWYRKSDAPGAGPSFPNLNKGMLSAVERSNRRYEDLKKQIKTEGLQKTIDTKDSILTTQEAQALVRNYGKSSFVVPQDVLAVSGMSNGLDPMVIINRQLQAQGMQPLAPPPSLATTSQLVSPAFQKLLYKSPSINRSARSLGTSNIFNPAIIPNNLGVVIQNAGQRNGVNPSLIAALAEIESGFNPNISSYNNSSFGVMQINKSAHPEFFALSNWRDPKINIDYGTKYYGSLLQKYRDPVAAAMAYNAGPGNYDAYLRGQLPDGPVKTEMINHGKKFAKAMYKYGGGSEALNNPALMRSGSPLEMSTLMRTPVRPLQSFAPNVSSITFDTGQPGIDVFFEDKQFPAVLPGVVKDISFQGSQGSGYGNYIVIESIDPDTNQKVDVLYSHLASKPNLRPGQMIRTGQIIGQQGGTGRVVSADGTIASIDFLRPAPQGSKDMTPYGNYESLRRRIASQFKS